MILKLPSIHPSAHLIGLRASPRRVFGIQSLNPSLFLKKKGVFRISQITQLHNCRIKKTNVQLCNCVVSREFISTTNDRMQKKAKCFFVSVVDRRQNDCRRGFAIVQVGPFRQNQKNKSVHDGAETGAETRR